MSTCSSQIALLLVVLLVGKHGISSIPACIIIDTNMVQEAEGDSASSNNRSSSSILLRNLRMLDHQRSSDLTKFLVEPIPISHVDLQETSSPVSISFNLSSLKKSLAEPVVERTFSPCSLELLNEIETQMVVPFEFRRLRMEQPDHQTKFLDDDPRESVPDLSTAVYERRSDPEGLRFCRICRDGLWTQLTVCETVRCDAELLRANPRLVTEWGEIKPLDGGALYTPATVYAIYAFAFGPHCKRCESNGQWSRYALPELCSGIKFFGHPTTNGIAMETKTTKATKVVLLSSSSSSSSSSSTMKNNVPTKYAKGKATSTSASTKVTSKKQ